MHRKQVRASRRKEPREPNNAVVRTPCDDVHGIGTVELVELELGPAFKVPPQALDEDLTSVPPHLVVSMTVHLAGPARDDLHRFSSRFRHGYD